MNRRTDLLYFAAACAVMFGGCAVLAVGFDSHDQRTPTTPPPTVCYGLSAQLPTTPINRGERIEWCDVVDAEGAGL